MRLATLFLLFFLLLPSVMAGVGFKLPSAEQRTVTFSPGASYQWTYQATGEGPLEITINGDLKEYATLIDPNPNGGPRSITFRLDLPEHLDPGRYFVWAQVAEARVGGTMMGGRAAVRGTVVVNVLYDEPIMEAKIEVDDTSKGEATQAHLTLKSWTTQNLPAVVADIVVYSDGNEVLRTRSPPVDLHSDESKTVDVPLQTQLLSEGPYTAKAIVHYAQNETRTDSSFRIGILDLILKSYTHNLTANKTNKFTFNVGSNWNQQVDGVYGEVSLLGLNEKTPDVIILPFAVNQFKTYLDLDGADLGTVNGTITLYFAGKTKEYPIQVDILSEQTAASVLEKPSGFFIPLNSMTILYFALILLVIINLILLFKRQKR